jgi:stage II sporulation protein P
MNRNCKEKDGHAMVMKKNKGRTAPKRENERRERKLWILALLFLTFWLLLCLAFSYKYVENAKSQHDKSDVDSLSQQDNAKFHFELFDSSDGTDDSQISTIEKMEAQQNQSYRDEFRPSMESLLQNSELTEKNVEKYFTHRPVLKGKNPLHTTGGEEVVYIYHSHSRESFLPYFKNTDKPEEAYHSEVNMTLVGKMLGEALERKGIGAQVNASDIGQELDDRGLNYGSSYPVSREHVQAAQKENRGLEIFFDLHRDSLRKDSTTATIQGKDFAQLLFVVGTGHADFEKNLEFTDGLHNEIESQFPGLSKGILEKDSSQGNGIYNQDLSPQSVIIEVGGVDNTAQELNHTIEAFVEVFSEYYWHGEK